LNAGAPEFALALVTSGCDRLPGHPQSFDFFALRCAENRPLGGRGRWASLYWLLSG